MKAHEVLPAAAPLAGFDHLHAAHCESGVSTALFREVGLDLSEPLVFGIGSGLFFVHLSFLRIMGHPLTSFRSMPGGIFSKAARRLGVQTQRETYRRPEAAMRRLDALLDEGARVGLQVNIFWLPYIPKAMRVHFNGHNLIALERRGDRYLVSDPIMEDLFECPADALERARFSGGPRFLSRGLMYRVLGRQSEPPLEEAVLAGLRETCDRMVRIPRVVPYFAVQGVRHLGRRMPRWPEWYGDRRAAEWLAGIVRMQEEIGTGGAGFRYLFAAFLQEAARSPGGAAAGPFSERMTAIGDRWRAFALQASRLARGRESIGWEALGAQVLELADAEEALFTDLDAALRGMPQLVDSRAVPAGPRDSRDSRAVPESPRDSGAPV
ncbi:MAG: BtrH N-terminal domain-containing protein [Myxococcota bacterium]